MPTIMIGKVAHEIADAGTAKAVVDALDEKTAKIDSLNTEVSTLSGKADALKTKVDEFEKEKENDDELSDEELAKMEKDKDDEIEKEVTARVDTISRVRLIAPEAKIDGMSAIDMKRTAIEATGTKLDGKDNAYINAMFDIKTATKTDDTAGNLNSSTAPHMDSQDDPRAKFMKKQGA